MNVKKWLRGLCAAVLCVAYVGTAGAAQLQKVPTAWMGAQETFPIWYAKQKGWDKEVGLDVELLYFSSGMDALSPLPAKAPYFNNSHAIERAIMYRNAIYARADMDPEVAYAIIKAVDENRAEWENISPIAPDWGTIYEYAPPYHEGVVRYYREKGIWQGAAVEQHEKLLRAVNAEK